MRNIQLINDLFKLDDISENDLINIGANEEYSIRDFAEIICEIVDYDSSKIIYDENRYVGAESKFLSSKKETLMLGKLHRTNITEGLAKTINWFRTKIVKDDTK